MILGLGVDLTRIARLEKHAAGDAFLMRVYTENERAYAESRGAARTQSLAAMFAAKEAVAKALGTGFSGFGPADVEVVHDGHGAPRILLHGGAEAEARARGVERIFVSLSHESGHAVAAAVLEGSKAGKGLEE